MWLLWLYVLFGMFVIMQINDYRIMVDSLSDWQHIEGMGDLHIGNIGADKNKIIERIKYIKNDSKRHTIIMGDLADCITVSDKRWDLKTYDPYLEEPDKQYEWVIDALEPIKHKIVGIHTGNHDETLRKKIALQLRASSMSEDYIAEQSDWVQKVCKRLNVGYLGSSAFTRLTFEEPGKKNRKVQFKIYSTHGSAGAGRTGNALNKLEDMVKSYNADIYLMGHTHKFVTDKQVYLDVAQRGNKLRKRTRLLGNTGGFLDGHLLNKFSYVEAMNLPPARTGTITVSIKPETYSLNIHS